MTEEEALQLWRDLEPLEATVRRRVKGAVGDPVDFDVRLWARSLSGKAIGFALKTADAHGLDVRVEVESGDPFLTIFREPTLRHPSEPRS